MINVEIERTDAWLKENEGELFLQAIEAVKDLRAFTPFVAEMIDEDHPERAAKAYLQRVLYGSNIVRSAPTDEVGALRARLAFTEDIIEVFFRLIIKDHFAHTFTSAFDADERVSYALRCGRSHGLTPPDILIEVPEQ